MIKVWSRWLEASKTQNSLKEYSHLIQYQKEFLNSKQTHFKTQPIRFRICSVWAEDKHSSAIFLQIMKSFSVYTPPIKVWWCYLWQESVGCSQKHLILLSVPWIISRVDSDCAFNTKPASSLLYSFLTTWFCLDIQSLGVNQRFLFSCFDLSCYWAVSFMPEKYAKSYLLHQSR